MEIPLPRHRVIVFNPSGRDSAGRRHHRLFWIGLLVAAAAIGPVAWWLVQPRPMGQPTGTAMLALTSTPSDALVLVDGAECGRTPASVQVSTGRHTIVA